MKGGSIFLSAVTGDDNEVDAGYLAMFVLMVIIAGAIPLMCLATVGAMLLDAGHRFSAQELGIGIGSVCTGLGVAIGAVGAFRMGDKPRAGVVTTTSSQSVTGPAMTASAPILGDIEKLTPKIGPEDVGKDVALVSPAPKKRKR